MDFLDSILNSMQKPPTASEAQRDAVRKQKEALDRKHKEEKLMLSKFRKRVEDKVANFLKEGTKSYLQFNPMEQMYRGIIREVAETAGLQVVSFGQEGIDRYAVVYPKERGPSEDEIAVRRAGGTWDEDKAAEMALQRIEMAKLAKQEALLDNSRKRKKEQEQYSGTFYKAKYAHLIGEDAALGAAKKTDVNKSYGEVPSDNKKDQRSIEQTMADIKAKKMKKAESAENSHG